jgi:cell division protein FtsB
MSGLLVRVLEPGLLRSAAVIALGAVAVLVGLSFAQVGLADYRLALQKQQLRSSIAVSQEQNRQLRGNVADLQTDEALERLARSELGWTRPGDTAVVVVRDRPAPGTPAPSAPTPASLRASP